MFSLSFVASWYSWGRVIWKSAKSFRWSDQHPSGKVLSSFGNSGEWYRVLQLTKMSPECQSGPQSLQNMHRVTSGPRNCVTIWTIWSNSKYLTMPLEPSCPVSTLFLLTYWLVHKASRLCCWDRCYHIFKLWTTCKEILGSILCLSPRSSLFNIWCYLQGQARIFSVACSVETPLWSVLPTGLSSNT